MSCGQLALSRAGFSVENYFASEIDKFAIQITQKNFPNTQQLGDVKKLDAVLLPKIDLLLGGSPCQGFSFAGAQLAFEDPRSKLFFEYVRVLEDVRLINPGVKFLLENVDMKPEYRKVITDYLGVEPIKINSALVSAQNRVRWYWTNLEGVKQPKDRGIVLEDIVEHGVPFLGSSDYLDKPADSDSKGLMLQSIADDINGHDCIKRVYSTKGKCPTLTANSGGNQEPKITPAAIRGRNLNKAVILGRRLDENGTRKDYDKSVPITQVLEVRKTNTDKCNCLTTVDKDTVLTYLEPGRYPDVYVNKIPYRKMTPLECERAQTVPDNYTEGVSASQRRKMLGNGWTIDIIVHILNSDITL